MVRRLATTQRQLLSPPPDATRSPLACPKGLQRREPQRQIPTEGNPPAVLAPQRTGSPTFKFLNIALNINTDLLTIISKKII
jgi:hypothetical protein